MSSLCTLLVCLSGFSRRSGDSSRASCHHVHVQWRKIWCKVVYWWQTTFQKLLTAWREIFKKEFSDQKYQDNSIFSALDMFRYRSNEDYRQCSMCTDDARVSRNTLAINKRSRQLCLFCLFPETWRYLPILSGNHINMYRCRSNEDYRDRFIFHIWACKGSKNTYLTVKGNSAGNSRAKIVQYRTA